MLLKTWDILLKPTHRDRVANCGYTSKSIFYLISILNCVIV